MKTLYVFCEGQTEQGFCKQVLAPHLYSIGFLVVHTIRVVLGRTKGVTHRGGVVRCAALRTGILSELKRHRDRDVHFTTMLDLYGLRSDFPGKDRHVRNALDPVPYVQALETAFGQDIGDPRFIPHLQLHEYETLLFADPDALAVSFDNCQPAIDQLKQEIKAFPTVEHINDSPQTAPSKRLIRVLPAYEGRKPTAGPDVAEMIGLLTLRQNCPHFDAWLKAIEGL